MAELSGRQASCFAWSFFRMTLTTYLIRRIWLNRSKGKRSKFVPFFYFRQFSQKLVSNFFSILAGMNLPEDGTNQLPKAGFDWIALKVIFQGRKGLNLPLFSNFDTYFPFIQNLFSNFFSILAWSFPRMVMMNCEEQDLIESL